jgi:hypothetical protein
MLQRLFSFTCLALAVLALAGCPSSDSGGGDGMSLQQKYQNALNISNATSRANKLIEVGREYNSAGDTANAQKALDAAFKAAGEGTDALSKAQAFNGVASAEAEFGRKANADDALKEARKAATAIEDAGLKVEQLGMIAVTFGTKMDDPSKASSYLKMAKETADGIAKPAERAVALVSLAKSHLQIAESTEADALLTAATETTQAIEDLGKRADAIRKIADQAAAMESAKAIDLYNEALGVAEEIDDQSTKAHRLAELARSMHRAGHTDQGKTVLKQASAAAEQIPDDGLKQEAQQKIAGYQNEM